MVAFLAVFLFTNGAVGRTLRTPPPVAQSTLRRIRRWSLSLCGVYIAALGVIFLWISWLVSFLKPLPTDLVGPLPYFLLICFRIYCLQKTHRRARLEELALEGAGRSPHAERGG
jgi:hypothetical protein